MRVAIDLTNSPHVPFFAPLITELRARGHAVTVTTRHFAQTIELAELHELDATAIGHHGGSSRAGKARAALSRSVRLWRHLARQTRHADGRRFDVALSHGSTDLPVACRLLGVPHVTIFDYEWAATQHRVNCALSWRVAMPDAIDVARLDAYRAAGKITTYPGLKEEYYLTDAALDPQIRASLDIADDALLAVLRPPADFALYHRGIVNEQFDAVLDRVRAMPDAVAVVLARTDDQRTSIATRVNGDASVVLPRHAIDAASLIAAGDVVISAGGTMNREAAALGVPVYTVFAGRMGGVDEALLRAGRLHQLTSADDVRLERRPRGERARVLHARAPADLLDLLIDGLAPAEAGH